jgi:hypothetical protein
MQHAFHFNFQFNLRFNINFHFYLTNSFIECNKCMLFTVLDNDVTNQSCSRLNTHVLLGISVAYLIIARANKKHRKKRFLMIKNYLKIRNFGIIDDLQFICKIFYLKILHEYPKHIFIQN